MKRNSWSQCNRLQRRHVLDVWRGLLFGPSLRVARAPRLPTRIAEGGGNDFASRTPLFPPFPFISLNLRMRIGTFQWVTTLKPRKIFRDRQTHSRATSPRNWPLVSVAPMRAGRLVALWISNQRIARLARKCRFFRKQIHVNQPGRGNYAICHLWPGSRLNPNGLTASV